MEVELFAKLGIAKKIFIGENVVNQMSEAIGDSYYYHPYQQQWQKLYPDKQFPTPQKYPNMYSKGAQTTHQVEYINPLFPNCSSKTCPKGLIDYQCQYENKCYLKLAELGVDVLLTFLIVTVVIGIVGKLVSFLYGVLSSVVLIGKMVACIGNCLQCLSFGMLDHGTTIQVNVENTRGKKHQEIKQKLSRLNIEIDVEEMNERKMKKIKQILEDYEIEEIEKSQE